MTGARKRADVQAVNYLTYVRMKQASPGMQPLGKVRAGVRDAVIFARLGTGITNLSQVAGHSIAFAHTNSIISFLAKIELAQAGSCARQFTVCTNLDTPRRQLLNAGQPQEEREAKVWGDEADAYAHRVVMAKVLQGEYSVGVAPSRRFNLRKKDGSGLVVLHNFESTPDVYVARPGLPADIVQALRDSLLALKDKALLEATKPSMQDGFEAVTDADFEPFRKLIRNEWSFFETCRTNSTPGNTKSSPASSK